MLKNLISKLNLKDLRRWISLILLALFSFFLFLNIIFFEYAVSTNLSSQSKLVSFFLFNIFIILIAEISFRFLYKLIKKKKYQFIKKINTEDLYHIPHPFLTAVYKKNSVGQKEMPVFYPLNKDKEFYFPLSKTNNEGFMDGEDGARDIVCPKPLDEKRIICIGASTTGNYIKYKNSVSSYPIELERLFNKKRPQENIKVINCGFGGWTSAELLINFVLKVFSYEPDIIIIYHGHNDISSYLTPKFEIDYSHSKKNFAFEYSKFRKNKFIPDVPLAFYNFLVLILLKNWNPRISLGEAISESSPNYESEFNGLNIYERNLEHIIKICLASDINVVMSSFAHYLHKDIKDSKIHQKIRSGIEKENIVTKKLADKYKLAYVDNYNLIPSEEKYFVDSIHFSPEGMKSIATNFYSEISKNF